MEHPPKRRRIERRRIPQAAEDDMEREVGKVEAEDVKVSQQVENHGAPNVAVTSNGAETHSLDLPASRPGSAPPTLHLSALPLSNPKLELRHRLPGLTGPVANAIQHGVPVDTQPSTTPPATVVNNNPVSVSAQIEAPAASASAAVTSESNPTPTQGDQTPDQPQPVDDVPGLVSPEAAVAAADARNQALAAEEKNAKQDVHLPPPPGATPLYNPASLSTPLQGSMTIQVPDGSSQQVLSSPSTPLPQTLSSAPSALSTPSIFSSTLPIISASQSQSSSTPTPSPNSTPSLSTTLSLPSSSINSTLSSSTSTSPTSTILSSSLRSSPIVTSTSLQFITSTSSSVILSSTISASLTATSSVTTSSLITSSVSTTLTTTASSFQSSSQSAPSSTSSVTGADVIPGGAGGATSTAGAPQSSSTAGSGSGGGGGMPSTPVLVGGIVGGVAGLVLIFLAFLFLLRRRKGKFGQKRTISPPMPQPFGPEGAPPDDGGTMTQRSSTAPIAAAGFFKNLRPSSSQTAATTETAPSERGFQKISGRKLPSVLTSGGDGYGDNAPGVAGPSGAPQTRGIAPGQGPFAGLAPALRPSPPQSLSGSSFYRDSRGFYGGVVEPSESGDPGSPTSSPPYQSPSVLAALGAADPTSPTRKPTIRPGPARTPVITQPGLAPQRNPSRVQPPPPRPVQGTPPPIGENPRDALGRSLASQDGSRTSRFRESTTPP